MLRKTAIAMMLVGCGSTGEEAEMSEILVADLVVAVSAGVPLTVAHGLHRADGTALVPTDVVPDRATPIRVASITDTQVVFESARTASATFRTWHRHSIGTQTDLGTLAWQGDGAQVPAPLFGPFVTATQPWFLETVELDNGDGSTSTTTFFKIGGLLAVLRPWVDSDRAGVHVIVGGGLESGDRIGIAVVKADGTAGESAEFVWNPATSYSQPMPGIGPQALKTTEALAITTAMQAQLEVGGYLEVYVVDANNLSPVPSVMGVEFVAVDPAPGE